MIKFINKMMRATFNGINGLWWSFYDRKNITIVVILLPLYLFAVFFFYLIKLESAVILLACLNIIIIEIVNTSIEKVIDIIHPGYHKGFGIAKDIAAAAVLMASVTAVIISTMILRDPVIRKIQEITESMPG